MRTFLLPTTILLCFLASSPAYSQVAGGTVSGRVTDASGANIPNTTIELENIDTGQRLTVVTDTAGVYTFSGVPGGRYRVITRTASNATMPTQEITVDASRPNTINISIPSGPRTDVQASAQAVPTSLSPATLQNVWNTRYQHYTPRANFVDRNGEAFGAYNLATLSEGTVSQLAGNTNGPAFSGQKPHTNLYHIDGIDNQNRITGGPLTYVSNEATNEFSLFLNQPTPLFGQTSGAKFNTIVRSGTNRVNGSLYNYFQNRWFNSVDRSMRAFGYNRDNHPRYDQNRLGGSLGVPIVPSKVFFFGNFEYLPLGFEAPMGGFTSVPTAAGLSALANANGVSSTNLGILQNALGSNVPTQTTGSQTIAGINVPVGTFAPVQRHWRRSLYGTGSLDFNMNEKDQFRFRYTHNETDATFFGNSPLQTPNWQRTLIASGAHYHTFGNAVTNELRFGYNRFGAEQYMQGMTGPAIAIAGGLNLGSRLMPTGIVNTYHVADAIAFRAGGHQLKFGFDGRRTTGFRDNFSQFLGSYAYSGIERFLLDAPPDVASQRAFGMNRLDMGHWSFFGFAQDTWNFAPGYTLELGVRYQYAKIPNAFRNQGLSSDFSVPGVLEFNDPKLQRWNFSPYVGIAASPWQNRTVIRAGFGMWYDANYWQPFMLGFAPQLSRMAVGNMASNTPGFLAGGGLTDPGTANQRAGVTSFIGDQVMPYSLQWNFAVQQAFWENTTIEFKYMGNRGVNQPIWQQLNYSGVTENRSLPLFTGDPTQAQLNGLPLTLNQLQTPMANSFTAAGFVNPINTINFGGNSYYHGATVTLNHRFTGGFQAFANYTWSRWEDTSTGTPLDIGMPFGMRTWSMYDKRHQANVTGMFELGSLLRDSWSGAARWLADFNVSGTYQYGLGNRLTPVTGLNSALANNAFGTTAIVNPNATGMGVSALTPLTNGGSNIVGYRVADPGARFYAGAPGVFTGFNRGGILMDDLHNVNLAASKRFGVSETAAFEIRGEAFNLFNRSNVTGYSVNSIGAGLMPPLGVIPGTVDINNLNNLSLLPSNSRMIQLALRLTF